MFLLPTRAFRKLILSEREFQIASLKRFLHSVRLGASLWQHVKYVTIGLLKLENKKLKSLSYRKKALNCQII